MFWLNLQKATIKPTKSARYWFIIALVSKVQNLNRNFTTTEENDVKTKNTITFIAYCSYMKHTCNCWPNQEGIESILELAVGVFFSLCISKCFSTRKYVLWWSLAVFILQLTFSRNSLLFRLDASYFENLQLSLSKRRLIFFLFLTFSIYQI